jgi:hypothetical protein
MTLPTEIDPQNSVSVAPWQRLWKITGATIAVSAILLIAIWLLWNHLANQRLQLALDQITSRHEPIYPADFTPPSLPDSQNAAIYLIAAESAMGNQWSPRASNFTFPAYPPFGAQWEQLAVAAEKWNLQTLALARQARQFDRAVWVQLSPRPIVVTLRLPYLNNCRALANLLADTAELIHLRGNDAEAIERVRDVIHLADSLDDNSLMLVTRLVSVGIDDLAVNQLRLIAVDHLAIENARYPNSFQTTRPIVPVRRQVLLDLIHQLLDEQKVDAAKRLAILSERMFSLDVILWLADQQVLLRPMFKLDAARMLRNKEFALRAVEQPNFPAAYATLAAAPPSDPPLVSQAPSAPAGPMPAVATNMTTPRFSRAASTAFGWTMDRYLMAESSVAADRRTTAITLAMQLYRADHGTWPANLNELVPTYLPAVPLDPFIASPTPIGYLLDKQTRPDGKDRPLLFFDPSGNPTTTPPPPTPSFYAQSPRIRDWRDVTLWQPAPTTAPAGGS